MASSTEEKCECALRLDKLRLDLEAGKDVGFVVVYFERGPNGVYDSIVHDVTTGEIMLGVLELQARAMERRGNDK